MLFSLTFHASFIPPGIKLNDRQEIGVMNIWKIIKENFNKPIESNPDLTKFNVNTCHLCNKKIKNKPVKNHCHYTSKMLGYAHYKCNLNFNLKKIM